MGAEGATREAWNLSGKRTELLIPNHNYLFMIKLITIPFVELCQA